MIKRTFSLKMLLFEGSLKNDKQTTTKKLTRNRVANDQTDDPDVAEQEGEELTQIVLALFREGSFGLPTARSARAPPVFHSFGNPRLGSLKLRVVPFHSVSWILGSAQGSSLYV